MQQYKTSPLSCSRKCVHFDHRFHVITGWSKFVCRVMAAGSIKMKQNGRIWWHLSSLRALRSKLQVVVWGPSRQWPSSRVTTRHKLDTIFRCLWNMDLTAASCPVANCFNPLRFINRECRRGSQITFFCPASLAQLGAI